MTTNDHNTELSTLPSESARRAEDSSIDWIEILSVLWASRKTIAYVVGAVTILSIIVSLLLPEYFRSTTTLLPETEKSRLASIGGGLSDVAALAGVNVGGETSLAKLYPTIIKSEAVLQNVIFKEYKTQSFAQPVNLIQFWEIKEKTSGRDFEVSLKKLREDMDATLDIRTNVVTIAIETREPQLSADILNTVTAELDKFIRTKKKSNASEQRKWIESRLLEVKQDLDKSENALRDFKEQNHRVSDSPKLLLEQERLIRDVQINATLYTELKKQFELIKIEEIKNIPIINVMDVARPAAKKVWPRTGLFAISAFFLALSVCCLYFVLKYRYGKFLQTLVTSFAADTVVTRKNS